jgi:hypothetical protein
VTKKDSGLPFHFHVLNLFKSWSNLGFDQDSNVHKNWEEGYELQFKKQGNLNTWMPQRCVEAQNNGKTCAHAASNSSRTHSRHR